MKLLSKPAFLFVCLCISFSMFGCAMTKSIWTSKPPFQKDENADFNIVLHPLKGGHDFFVNFRLDITNKSDDILKIDWNKTLYLHNGRKKGVFVFKGINPTDVKNRTVPDEVIRGGSAFSKVVAPYKLLAWVPGRSRTLGDSISAGILPNGENGMHLVIKHKGKEMIKKLTVLLEEKQ